MRFAILFMLGLTPVFTCAQSSIQDTVFFNEDWDRITARDSVHIWGLKEYNSDSLGWCRYYTTDGNLYALHHEKKDLKHGWSLWFNGNQTLRTFGYYELDSLLSPLMYYNRHGEPINSLPGSSDRPVPKYRDDVLISTPDFPPHHVGGPVLQAYIQFLYVRYTEQQYRQGLNDVFVYEIVVSDNGELTSYTKLHGEHPDLQARCEEGLATMNQWQPAHLAGKPTASVGYVVFTFDKDLFEYQRKHYLFEWYNEDRFTPPFGSDGYRKEQKKAPINTLLDEHISAMFDVFKSTSDIQAKLDQLYLIYAIKLRELVDELKLPKAQAEHAFKVLADQNWVGRFADPME